MTMTMTRGAIIAKLISHSDKILIRGVNWIGDAVLTLPTIKNIRRAFPNAHISLLVKPWVSDVFKDNPDINEIILYDDRYKGISGRFRLAKMLRAKQFGSAILLQNAFDAAFITWLAGIPERTGYKRDGRGLFLTNAIKVSAEVLKQHQVNYYLNILKSIDIETDDTPPFIYLTDTEKEKARGLVSSSFSGKNFPVIGINPGATYGSAKRWPPEYFAELIIKIIKELDGRVIIFGSPSEVEIANEIIKEINKLKIKLTMELIGSRILVMSGKTGLRDLSALISECDVFISNDSGPMHIASALFVPVVAIFGSTNSTATGPFGPGHKVITKGLSCSPCMERKCPEGHFRCMTEITSDEVYNAVTETLSSNKAVFLDKDGTIIEDKNYLNSFDGLKILTGVKKNLEKLKDAGFMLIGITNQSGIGRGIVDEQFVLESNEYLQKKLNMDGFYYCPHHPDDHCPCRKPGPVMILKARLEHRLNLKSSYMIGDKESDVLTAKKTGFRGVLLSSTPLFENSSASYIAKDLSDAVEWILEKENNSLQN